MPFEGSAGASAVGVAGAVGDAEVVGVAGAVGDAGVVGDEGVDDEGVAVALGLADVVGDEVPSAGPGSADVVEDVVPSVRLGRADAVVPAAGPGLAEVVGDEEPVAVLAGFVAEGSAEGGAEAVGGLGGSAAPVAVVIRTSAATRVVPVLVVPVLPERRTPPSSAFVSAG